MIRNNEFYKKSFTIPKDWEYRGEGNCNLVISLPKSKKILRIRKVDRPVTFWGRLLAWILDIFYWYCGNGLKDELRDLKFYMKVMRPLVGCNYVSEARQVELSPRQINLLEKELENYRPVNRKGKCLQYGRATIFDDFAFLHNSSGLKLFSDCFAIEIKPKQGWRPFHERYFPSCIYCMNQYLKMESQKTNEISKYCPEDLFSGNQPKMIAAIKALIQSPQNNLQILKNGSIIYNYNKKIDFNLFLNDFFNTNDSFDNKNEEFCSLIQKSLLLNLDSKSDECQQKLYCKWNKYIQNMQLDYKLPKGCILEKILSIQMLDSEGTHYYYKLLANCSLDEFSYVKKLLKAINSHSNSCLKCRIMILSTQNYEKDLDFVPYLISAVARDLSIMLTFCRVEDDNLSREDVIETQYGKYLVSIGAFDLYPKPMSTIIKHFNRNRKIFDAYLKSKIR